MKGIGERGDRLVGREAGGGAFSSHHEQHALCPALRPFAVVVGVEVVGAGHLQGGDGSLAGLRVLEHSALLGQVHIVPNAALPRRHGHGLEAALAAGVQLGVRHVLAAAAVHECVAPPSAVLTLAVAVLLSAGCCCCRRRSRCCLLLSSGLPGSPSALPGSLVALAKQHDALLAAGEAEHHHGEHAEDGVHEQQLGHREQVQRLGAPVGEEAVRLRARRRRVEVTTGNGSVAVMLSWSDSKILPQL